MCTEVAVRPVVSRNAAGGMVDLVDELDGPWVAVDEHATRVVANTPTTSITVTRGLRPDVVAIPVLNLMWILPFYGPAGKAMTSHPPGSSRWTTLRTFNRHRHDDAWTQCGTGPWWRTPPPLRP